MKSIRSTNSDPSHCIVLEDIDFVSINSITNINFNPDISNLHEILLGIIAPQFANFNFQILERLEQPLHESG